MQHDQGPSPGPSWEDSGSKWIIAEKKGDVMQNTPTTAMEENQKKDELRRGEKAEA